MEKTAESAYPLQPLIARRWSPRAFSEHALSKADIAALLEAARWAPSCFNEQPWSFIITEKSDQDAHEKAVACLVEANQTWASKAPLLLFGLAATRFQRNEKPNRHAYHDLGLAAAQLTLQATSMGLHVHQMAGILQDKIRETYALPDHVDAVTAIAVGFMGKVEDLPEGLAEKEKAPRERKPLSDIAFSGSFGTPFSF